MNTLWAFGDSFTQSYVPPKNNINHVRNWRHEYIEWKGYDTKVYPEFIAKKLNLNLINKGIGGCDNSHIFEEFCKVASEIQKNDIVIFGWTDVHRFRFFNNMNQCLFYSTYALDKGGGPIFYNGLDTDGLQIFSQDLHSTFDSISIKTIEEILINRSSKMFLNEICNWIQLINLFLKNINVTHWSWDSRNSSCKNMIISPTYEQIYRETNGSVKDYHWSENGQKMFSELLLKKINKDNCLI